MNDSQVINALSVDVEDYFQVSAFERHISRDKWDNIPARVERNTDRLLELFGEHNVRATFFMLAWTAERFPVLLRRIQEAGHEIACHGYDHVRATRQSPVDFKADVTKSKRILEDIGGLEVKGFRAASFSITSENPWAWDVLGEAEYKYSSSIYPIHHDLYGIPDAPRFSFRCDNSELLEIPISTVKLGSRNLPCGGGGYFRLLPFTYSRWAINRLNKLECEPAVFYFHPWEIDSYQPRMQQLGVRTRIRHYTNLKRMEAKIEKLLKAFAWARMDEVFLSLNRDGSQYAVGD